VRDSRGSPSFLRSSTRSPRSVRCASSPTCQRSASRLAWRAWRCPSSARSPSHWWCWRSDSRFGARRSRASGIELDAVLPSTGHHPRLMIQHLRSAVREPCNGSPLPPASLGMRKALWDGVATAMDGRPYENTYSWFLTGPGGEDRERKRLLRHPGIQRPLDKNFAESMRHSKCRSVRRDRIASRRRDLSGRFRPRGRCRVDLLPGCGPHAQALTRQRGVVAPAQ